jgi:hypothetical protein
MRIRIPNTVRGRDGKNWMRDIHPGSATLSITVLGILNIAAPYHLRLPMCVCALGAGEGAETRDADGGDEP